MIIIGYPGIGKTTLARKSRRYVDLESSLFMVNGKRVDDWYILYCNIAKDISRQGNDVFVSSHEDVVRTLELMSSVGDNLEVLSIVPEYSVDMMDKWVLRLKNRYEETQMEKDRRSYEYVKDNYQTSILSILRRNIYCEMINDLHYSLEAIIERRRR